MGAAATDYQCGSTVFLMYNSCIVIFVLGKKVFDMDRCVHIHRAL